MKTVLFVCAHGAYRSRLAAAFFNAAALGGWRAASAGQEPQESMSDAAVGLAAGTAAEPYLELDRPRAIADFASPDRVVSIDCDVSGAERWTLATQRVSPEQRDEIRALAERFAALLGGS